MIIGDEILPSYMGIITNHHKNLPMKGIGIVTYCWPFLGIAGVTWAAEFAGGNRATRRGRRSADHHWRLCTSEGGVLGWRWRRPRNTEWLYKIIHFKKTCWDLWNEFQKIFFMARPRISTWNLVEFSCDETGSPLDSNASHLLSTGDCFNDILSVFILQRLFLNLIYNLRLPIRWSLCAWCLDQSCLLEIIFEKRIPTKQEMFGEFGWIVGQFGGCLVI